MRLLKDRKGISPVITTVIIVAVGITIAIAVALWMTGLVGAFMGYEKIEIRSCFASGNAANGWDIKITYVNTGSTPASIDNVFLNGVPHIEWGGVSLEEELPWPANIGEEVKRTIKIEKGGATFSDQKLTSGVTVTIKLHSTGGKEYFTSVVLP